MIEDNLVVGNCPLCNGNCLHLARVEIIQSEYKTTITRSKTVVTVEKPGDARGSIIRTYYWCEQCRKNFYKEEQFHKGSIFISIVEDERHPDEELWRD